MADPADYFCRSRRHYGGVGFCLVLRRQLGGSHCDLARSWFALFVVVSLVAMALVRPMARKWVQPKLVKTNADRILGQEAVVLEEIDNLRGIGQVKVGGAIWTARSTQDEPIPKGTLVRVERIEGVKAIVSLAGPTEKEEAATTP